MAIFNQSLGVIKKNKHSSKLTLHCYD